MIERFLAWFMNTPLGRKPIADWPFSWIYAPTPNALAFATRNTIASFVALGIAFWMELGEPQWAAMTVWITAQGSRGESLSKGRWRMVGTVMGVVAAVSLVATVPQAPWLFIPALGLWAALCTGLATLVHNFRSYAFVLAAYTCAIIAIDSSAEPDHVFQIAMARGTYIFLGVICEMVAGVAFSASLASKARSFMRARLLQAVSGATAAVYDILREEPPPESNIRAVFSQTLTLNDQLEFTAVEVGHNEYMIQCAYGAIGILSRIMSRALGMRTRLASVSNRSDVSQDALIRAGEFLEALPQRLSDPENTRTARRQLDELLHECVHRVQRTLEEEHSPEEEAIAVNDRVTLQGLRLLLEEYRALLAYYVADPAENLDIRRYRLKHMLNWRAAMHNALRSAFAIIAAGLIWEVTAWPQGGAFISFVAVVVGRFATFENTVLVSQKLFYGACVAALASIIPVFLLIPVAPSFGALVLALVVPMFIGGLAARNPKTAMAAASYCVFFPALLGLANQGRLNELGWFNGTMALLAGIGTGVIIFKCILPFDERRVCEIMRERALFGLRRISSLASRAIDENRWIGRNTQSMERLIRYAGKNISPLMDQYLHGTLAVMTIGRNLMHLRFMQADPAMPPQAQAIIREMFSRIARHGVTTKRQNAEVYLTLDALRAMEYGWPDVRQRLLLTDAIGSLMIVTSELEGNAAFLDTKTFMRGLMSSDAVA